MNTRVLTTTGLVLAVVLLFAVNIMTGAALGRVRIDLTEHGLYTLSPGTRNILAKLEEPITLRFYLSEHQLSQVPQMAGYATRVKTLLAEYERLSGGKVTVHVIDPEPFSEEEDRAVGYGMRAVPVGAGEESLYFGLVGTNSTDDEEAIPFLTTEREEFLEYDVTKLVHALTDSEQAVVGVISSLPIEGSGPQIATGGGGVAPWMIVDQMRQLFDVRSLHPTLAEIPAEIDVLVVVHPQNLSELALYAIDQFVLRGGRAVVFVDPYSEAQRPQAAGFMMAPPNRRSDFDRLLAAWGVALEDDAVVADLSQAVKVRMERSGRLLTFDYPVWINVLPENMEGDDIVTGDLGNLSFGTPGSLVPTEGAATTFVPLVRTTDNATTFTSQRVEQVQDPQELLRDYRATATRYVLAARVSGKVGTAFPDGQPAVEGAEEAAAPQAAPEPAAAPASSHLAESAEDANLVIVADTDLLADRFWVVVQDFLGTRLAVPSAANGSFLVNAIDNLSGSSDLISVRNRGSFVRPFERVNAIRREAEARFREKEQTLIARLEETEAKLLELEDAKRGEEGLILTDAQREELIGFRQEKLRVRKELREVRRALREDIATLESQLKFANIGLVPILIALAGIATGAVRGRRRRAAMRAGAAHAAGRDGG